jgi:hypothetical protein
VRVPFSSPLDEQAGTIELHALELMKATSLGRECAMAIQMNQLFVLAPSPPESLHHFLDFWAARYRYPYDELNEAKINGPRAPENLRALFKWKIGNRLFESKRPGLERNFIERRHEANKLIKELAACEPHEAARQFLDHFEYGGPIYRIFWLHCWNARFPIYDQHVHRAMTYILDGKRKEELGRHGEAGTVRLYLDRYLPFFNEFRGMDSRQVDRALWRFGKSLKDGNLPPLKRPSPLN